MKTRKIQRCANRMVVNGYDLTASMPFTDIIRRARKTLRVLTFTISALFINALVAPDIWAIQDGLEKKRQAEKIILSGTPEQQFNQALLKLQAVAGDKQKVINEYMEKQYTLLMDILLTLRALRFPPMVRGSLQDLPTIRQKFGIWIAAS